MVRTGARRIHNALRILHHGYDGSATGLTTNPRRRWRTGWTANEYGKFTSAYGWFNVFFLMLIFGGMILDKMGVRFTGLMATSIMLIGVFIKWFGISHNFDGATVTVFGSEYGYPLVVASLGYALFGVGVEIAGITVSKIIVNGSKAKRWHWQWAWKWLVPVSVQVWQSALRLC